jgi:Putative transposase of IS4/5 family (DUF4096)
MRPSIGGPASTSRIVLSLESSDRSTRPTQPGPKPGAKAASNGIASAPLSMLALRWGRKTCVMNCPFRALTASGTGSSPGKTGAPWRDLPEWFGLWGSVWKRFDRWSKKGVWERIFEALQDPDLEWLIIDSTVVRAHQHAAGAEKRGSRRSGVGPFRGRIQHQNSLSDPSRPENVYRP